MRYVGLAFLAAAAVGLTPLAPACAAEIVTTPDGHYYRLVPLKGPLPNASQVTIIPGEATASVPQSSNCRIVPMSQYEYQAQWVTACGPP
jgi:hypothetical protein